MSEMEAETIEEMETYPHDIVKGLTDSRNFE